jgi:hypothetical protein
MRLKQAQLLDRAPTNVRSLSTINRVKHRMTVAAANWRAALELLRTAASAPNSTAPAELLQSAERLADIMAVITEQLVRDWLRAELERLPDYRALRRRVAAMGAAPAFGDHEPLEVGNPDLAHTPTSRRGAKK